ARNRCGETSCPSPTTATALFFFFSSRRRHTRSKRDWSSDVCSSDLSQIPGSRPGAGAVRFTNRACATRAGAVAPYRGWSSHRDRSEERRVGKECRTGWWAEQSKKKGNAENRTADDVTIQSGSDCSNR